MPGRGRAELLRLVADLGVIPRDLKQQLRPEIRKSVAPLADRVRANASWSSRIPRAVKVSVSLGRKPGVRMFVDSKIAPHAVYYENEGEPGSFKHPLFGNRRHWYRALARPFFYRAVEENLDGIADDLGDTVIRVARRHGFH